jgi:hypothetical protein
MWQLCRLGLAVRAVQTWQVRGMVGTGKLDMTEPYSPSFPTDALWFKDPSVPSTPSFMFRANAPYNAGGTDIVAVLERQHHTAVQTVARRS